MRETTTTPLIAWSRTFPAVPEQAGEARRFLAAILAGRRADDAIPCLSELVANACLHSRSRQPGGRLTVRVQLHGDRVRVEVGDQGGLVIHEPGQRRGAPRHQEQAPNPVLDH
jgi:anti-sigma regulatory factor (Ser/Thr protein kinase)